MPSDHLKVIAQGREATVAPFAAVISLVLMWNIDIATSTSPGRLGR